MEILNNGRLPEDLRARKLEESDYDKGVLQVLGVLTTVGETSREEFARIYQQMFSGRNDYLTVVLEEIATEKLAGVGTIFIEQKFIRSCGKVGHIEDIVVNPEFQSRGLGKVLIEMLTDYGKEQGCYKTILDCAEGVKSFYEKCGFSQKGYCMAIYY